MRTEDLEQVKSRLEGAHRAFVCAKTHNKAGVLVTPNDTGFLPEIRDYIEKALGMVRREIGWRSPIY